MYTQTTLGSLVNTIASLISDPTFIQWKQQEITFAIYEALRVWSGYTAYWRERGAFNIDETTVWVDISAELPTLRSRTVTIDSIDREIQYHFFEQSNGVSGAGMSGQFDNASIIRSIVRARNRFALDAALPITRSQIAISPPPSGRMLIDEDTVYLHRAAWVDASGKINTLWREDGWSEDKYNPLWTLEPDTPFAYSQAETRPVEIQLYPAPIASGELEVLTVDSVDIDTTDDTSTLQMPDDFCHAIKYAAMADILSMDGETFDPFRADYCEQRYQQSVIAARLFQSVLRVQLNDVPLPLDALQNIDASQPYWRNRRDKPTNVGATFDFMMFADMPDQLYGVTVDVARSAPIPTTSGDYIQIGREDLQHIIDYVQHYLSFKLGGDEFRDTFSQYDSTLKAIAQRNKVLSAQCHYLNALFQQPRKESDIRPDMRDEAVNA